VSCDYYADPAYSLAAYLAAYDPATWGTPDPSGPLEEARARSAATQGKNIKLAVPSNTTIVGLGASARIEGLNLNVKNVDNVIIRNVQFVDAHDCFPAWDPTDGATGNWNSEYDNVSVYGATHVWVDHNTFTDGQNPDSRQPLYFGRPWQVHDGQLDITNGSDYVTYSWNVFTDHDKTNLLGSTNSPTYDLGKLHITVHHNLYRNVIQRLPRVRYGQVHVYDNLYQIPRKTAVNGESAFEYALGVGVQSAIYAEKNAFELGPTVPAGSLLWNWGGTQLTAKDNLVNGKPVDIIAAYNATHDPDFGTDAGWTPSLVGQVDPVQKVSPLVRAQAGVGRVR
jgi:pectate lyase